MKTLRLLFLLITVSFAVLSACAPAGQLAGVVPTNTQEIMTQPTAEASAAAVPAATEIPYLIAPLDFTGESNFCINEPEDNQFILTCADGTLTVKESEKRRKTDIYLLREEPVSTRGFILSALVNSQPADTDKLDENNFGFYYTSTSGATYAVRIQGQYLNFEQWDLSDGIEVLDTYNKTYAPELFYAGSRNEIRMVCEETACSLYANDAFIARSPFTDSSGITAIGFFTASAWDQKFGTVKLESFSATDLPADHPEAQPFLLIDNLTTDHGTFSQMGLSGAFSEFEADGFHFSPVIPYGYYAAKAGPSYKDMSVSAAVEMDFNPGVQATRYAGVVCRSSLDGMYMAVLRVDGTYSIYRDSTRRPFSLLAYGQIDGIQEGRSKHAIQLDCNGERISLTIDGSQVETFSDSHYSVRFGRAGLYTKAGGDALADAIIFSDLVIKEIR